MKKIIAFISSDKLEEYRLFWSEYHIAIEHMSPLETYDDRAILNVLKEHYDPDAHVLCVMTECTRIIDDCLITNLWLVDAQGAFTHTADPIPVHVDMERPALGLGWDNQVVLKNGYSCYEMAAMGFKNIGRQYIFSIMAERLCHDTHKTWNYLTHDMPDEVLHFDDTLLNIVLDNPYLSNSHVNQSFLGPLFQRAIQNAGFVRTGNTRKLRNYWLPGLNAGIPAVPKSDLFHETTFLVHDLCHFIFPDIVYNGNPDTLTHYHMARMASEAITMTFADMWFVDIIQSHYSYDYKKRGIYPIFEKIRAMNPNITPYEMAWINVQYAVLGDTSGYEQYIQLSDPIWMNFEQIYSRFFIEDHHWTFHNRESMRQRSKAYQEFTNDYQSLITQQKLTLSTTMSNLKDVFDDMWNRYIKQDDYRIVDRESNYWLGQAFIFYQYPDPHRYHIAFKQALKQKDYVTVKHIYNIYMLYLLEHYFINKDEYYHYQHIYPFFKPHYVFYERKSEEILKDVADGYIR